MHNKTSNIYDFTKNSSSFFKYQMRIVTSHHRLNRNDLSEPRCDAERRRGELCEP